MLQQVCTRALFVRWTETVEGTKFEVLFRFRAAFMSTFEFMVAVETFGCNAATCESTFSTLTNDFQCLMLVWWT